jgi:alanyl-tRNA synthetase
MVLQARKLGKSVYVFSVDQDQGKVAHVNFVAEDAKAKGLDGRTWANAISDILGGKVSEKKILYIMTS